MPKDKLTDYSATNASNTDVGGVNTDEGMLPSAVNNAIREVMTHLKNFASGTDGIDVLSLADDDASAAIKLQAPASVTADTTFTLPDGDGTDGQVLSTDGSGALSFVNTTPAPSLIINGDMAVAQRGTSKTALGNGNGGYHTVDRFRFEEGGAPTYEYTMSQSTEAPDGFGYSLKLECTTADTALAAADSLEVRTRLEGQDLQVFKKGTSNAEKMALSFWVRSDKTGTYTVGLIDKDNSNRITSKSYSIDTADTWEYKTLIFDGDTTGAFTNDNNRSLDIGWYLGAGANYTTGTLATTWQADDAADRVHSSQVNLSDTVGNEWYITGVKLEVGDTATPFLHESYGETLLKCYRYYREMFIEHRNDAVSNRSYRVTYPFSPQMRTAPDGDESGMSFGSVVGSAGTLTENKDYVKYFHTATGNGNSTYHSGTLKLDAEL
jgi:hypothetical protein